MDVIAQNVQALENTITLAPCPGDPVGAGGLIACLRQHVSAQFPAQGRVRTVHRGSNSSKRMTCIPQAIQFNALIQTELSIVFSLRTTFIKWCTSFVNLAGTLLFVLQVTR